MLELKITKVGTMKSLFHIFSITSLLLFSHLGLASQPNIILILADDMGYADIGMFGGDINTPNIDKLAQQGITYTQFYNNAKCVESRTSLLSGLYYHQTIAKEKTNRYTKEKSHLGANNNVTLAEVLKQAGYHTSMVGKWHVNNTPRARGFDQFYGFLDGYASFWQPEQYDQQDYQPPLKNFYATDALADAGLSFIEQAVKTNKPFFSYMAFNAPHYPLHAPEQDIAKYQGKFDAGWDIVRNKRIERLKQQAIIPNDFQVMPRLTDRLFFDNKDVKDWHWDKLLNEQKIQSADLMEVYAAMVDRLDQNIGKIMQRLNQLGVADNTLILFLSDNGGSPYAVQDKPNSGLASKGSFRTLTTPWAQVNSAPFAYFKRYINEGGISTPMIAYWPKGIKSPGTRNHQVRHIMDFMPTFIELAGTSYPKTFQGKEILPLQGYSFSNNFSDKMAPDYPVLFWEYLKNKGVRQGDMKAVFNVNHKKWQLFNIAKDRGETTDLAAQFPQLTQNLQQKWQAWYNRVTAQQHY